MRAKERSEDSLNFEGFQSEQRIIESLRLRIDYQSPRNIYSKRATVDDWIFSYSHIRGSSNFSLSRPSTNLDPYAIRRAFEAIRNPDGAARFLNEAGNFWPFIAITWKQFQEWQRFFGWLRVNPTVARNDPDGRKAWDAAVGRGSEFFSESDKDFTHSRFPPEAQNEIGPEDLRGIEGEDRQTLWALRRFVSHPQGPGSQARISLGWFDTDVSYPPEDWESRRAKKVNPDARVPFLLVEAHNALEAIAATIYADHAQGMRYGRCKHCARLFKIESAHGQEFCAAPKHLGSSPCKNAYLQSQRRLNEKRAITLLIQGWDRGMSEAEIRASAEQLGIRLSPEITAKAKRRQSRKITKGTGGEHVAISAR
jgi:hypothetical protein